MLPKTKEVLDLIANDELFKKYDIRFVGGTALSYLCIFLVKLWKNSQSN